MERQKSGESEVLQIKAFFLEGQQAVVTDALIGAGGDVPAYDIADTIAHHNGRGVHADIDLTDIRTVIMVRVITHVLRSGSANVTANDIADAVAGDYGRTVDSDINVAAGETAVTVVPDVLIRIRCNAAANAVADTVSGDHCRRVRCEVEI
jgi:hypothetical protein